MTIRWKVALLLVVVLGLLAPARAGTITIQSASGPGGTGVPSGVLGTTARVALTYSSINYMDVVLHVDAAGTYELYEGGGSINVANRTGLTWTNFTLGLYSAPPGTQFTGADPDEFGRFGTVVMGPNYVTYTGGMVPSSTLVPQPPFSTFGPAVTFT